METEFLKLVAGILRDELGLEPEQVLLVDQKFDLPSDNRLYVSLSLLGSRDFGAKTEYAPNPVTGELVETQVINRQEMYGITLLSRGSEARTRSWEIPAALNSTRAQQVQEENSFKIGNLPVSMNKVPDEDGTARLAKYVLTVLALVAYKKSKPVEYFDQFALPKVTPNP